MTSGRIFNYSHDIFYEFNSKVCSALEAILSKEDEFFCIDNFFDYIIKGESKSTKGYFFDKLDVVRSIHKNYCKDLNSLKEIINKSPAITVSPSDFSLREIRRSIMVKDQAILDLTEQLNKNDSAEKDYLKKYENEKNQLQLETINKQKQIQENKKQEVSQDAKSWFNFKNEKVCLSKLYEEANKARLKKEMWPELEEAEKTKKMALFQQERDEIEKELNRTNKETRLLLEQEASLTNNISSLGMIAILRVYVRFLKLSEKIEEVLKEVRPQEKVLTKKESSSNTGVSSLEKDTMCFKTELYISPFEKATKLHAVITQFKSEIIKCYRVFTCSEKNILDSVKLYEGLKEKEAVLKKLLEEAPESSTLEIDKGTLQIKQQSTQTFFSSLTSQATSVFSGLAKKIISS